MDRRRTPLTDNSIIEEVRTLMMISRTVSEPMQGQVDGCGAAANTGNIINPQLLCGRVTALVCVCMCVLQVYTLLTGFITTRWTYPVALL